VIEGPATLRSTRCPPSEKESAGPANARPPGCVTRGMRSSWTGGCALAQTADVENIAIAVHRCEAGAFERFVEQFESGLLNYAERILDNRFDAQEVVQDVFLRAHEALTRRYDLLRVEQLSLKPWLFRIARNLCLNQRRGMKSKMTDPLSSFDDGRLGPLVPSSSVSAQVEQRQERAALEKALATLPPESRELIVLRFMEEMSYADISSTVGVDEPALRGRVFRSLKLLRDALAPPEKMPRGGKGTATRGTKAAGRSGIAPREVSHEM
jgi:RNA polymerase sigma-70 factor (ECF subfamily)